MCDEDIDAAFNELDEEIVDDPATAPDQVLDKVDVPEDHATGNKENSTDDLAPCQAGSSQKFAVNDDDAAVDASPDDAATEVSPAIAPVAKKPSFKKPVKKLGQQPEASAIRKSPLAPQVDEGLSLRPAPGALAPTAVADTDTPLQACASTVSADKELLANQDQSVACLNACAARGCEDSLQAAPQQVATAKAGDDSSAQPASKPPSKPSLSRPAFRAPTIPANASQAAGLSTENAPGVMMHSGPPDPSKADKKRKAPKDPKEPKEPRAQSAYNFFCSAKRSQVKEEQPGASFGEITKRLAEMWKALDDEGKAPYVQKANDDKARVQQLKASMPPVPKAAKVKKVKEPKEPKPANAPKAPSKPRQTKKKSTEASATAQGIMDPKPADASNATAGEPVDGGAATTSANPLGLKVAATESSPVKSKTSDAEELEVDKAEESDDELERENCDWTTHPAEAIVCATTHGKYLVKRKGVDYTDYGLVDIQSAKRQCTDDRSVAACPVSAEMINRYEAHRKRFWQESHSRMSMGELDLDDLNAGSPLEMCHLLGKLRDDNYPLHKVDRKKSAEKDIMMSVPLMGTCLIIQTIVKNEREINSSLRAELDQAREKIKQLQTKSGMLVDET